MALELLEEIASSLQNSDFFFQSWLTKPQIRQTRSSWLYVSDGLTTTLKFIGLKHLDDCSAANIVNEIKTSIKEMGLDLKKLRGQCYDGCSTMAGAKGGVATLMKGEEKRALYTHCYGHATNLACSDSIRQVKAVRDAHDTVHEISKLVRKSPKRDGYLEKMKREMDDNEQGKHAPRIVSFCPTRWTVRGKTLDSILKNYSNLQNLWEWALENCSDTEMKARIRGVSIHMEDFDFYFGVALGETLLRHSDNLSSTLQKEEMSAAQAQSIAAMTVKTLLSIRNEDSFSLFWEKTTNHSEEVGVNKPKLPRQKRAPSKLNDTTSEHYFPNSVQNHYRAIYFEAIDTLTSSLKDRFDQTDFQMYSKLEQVLIKCAKSDSYEKELVECCLFYDNDFDVSKLRTQLQTFSTLWKEHNHDTSCLLLSDIINYFRTLSRPEILLMSEVARLLKLIIVMPATNAVSERSFSAMRRLKTYLRTNMSKSRLNNLMMLHVHKNRTYSLDLLLVANRFADTPHRQEVFGKFTTRDQSKPASELKTHGTQTEICC